MESSGNRSAQQQASGASGSAVENVFPNTHAIAASQLTGLSPYTKTHFDGQGPPDSPEVSSRLDASAASPGGASQGGSSYTPLGGVGAATSSASPRPLSPLGYGSPAAGSSTKPRAAADIEGGLSSPREADPGDTAGVPTSVASLGSRGRAGGSPASLLRRAASKMRAQTAICEFFWWLGFGLLDSDRCHHPG